MGMFNSFLVGCLWGLINMAALYGTLKAYLLTKNRAKTLLFLLLKFPLLYTLGYLLLRWSSIDPLGLICGFSFILIGSMLRNYVWAKR